MMKPRLASVLAAACGLAGCVDHPMSYLSGAAGPASAPVQTLAWGFVGIAIGVVVIIAVMISWAVVSGRRATRREGDVVHRDAHGLGWIYWGIGITVPVLVAMTMWSFAVTREVSARPAGPALQVEVTGHLWWWELRYPDATPGNIFSTANEMVIPTGMPVRLDLTSADVIHDFWVPKLGPKIDVIPGQQTHAWLQADRPGTYLGQCAEYCGLEHARMGIRVVALAPAQFAAWQQAMRAPAVATAGHGAQVFATACSSCHTVRGTQAGGILGPELTHLALRSTLAAGALPNTRQGRLDWVGNPQAVKPGAQMPDIPLSPADLSAVVDYLGELR